MVRCVGKSAASVISPLVTMVRMHNNIQVALPLQPNSCSLIRRLSVPDFVMHLCMKDFMVRCHLTSFPGPREGGEKGLVSTVCACA